MPAEDDEQSFVSHRVSGSALNGITATISDVDDVIEFGLLSRMEGEPTNLLNVSIVIDADEAQILCVSDTRDDLNFSGKVKPEQSADGLSLACDYFAQVLGSTASA